MSLTLAVRLTATIADALDVEARCSAYAVVDPDASFNAVIATLNTWLTDLDACTDGQIIATALEVIPDLPEGLKSAAAAPSRVEQTGILDYSAAGDLHLWGFAIPAISNSDTVTHAGRIVLTDGSPVKTLSDLLTSGGTAVLAWTNATSQALTAWRDALLCFRQHSRQLARATYES